MYNTIYSPVWCLQLRFMAYSSDLYANHLEAESSPQSLALVIFIVVGANYIGLAYPKTMLWYLTKIIGIPENNCSLVPGPIVHWLR